MEEAKHISSKHIADVLHARDASAVGLDRPVSHMETGIHNRLLIFFGRVQITFGGHRHQNQIVANSDLLTFGPLLTRGMHGPPAGLALAVLLQTHIKRQLVIRRRRGQTCQVLCKSKLLINFDPTFN